MNHATTPQDTEHYAAWSQMRRETRALSDPAECQRLGIDGTQPHITEYLDAIARYQMEVLAGGEREATEPLRLEAEAGYVEALLAQRLI